jgi:hypothetical protein
MMDVISKHHFKMSAAPYNLCVANEDCKKLSNEAAAVFHTIVAKALYVTKRARPDMSSNCISDHEDQISRS